MQEDKKKLEKMYQDLNEEDVEIKKWNQALIPKAILLFPLIFFALTFLKINFYRIGLYVMAVNKVLLFNHQIDNAFELLDEYPIYSLSLQGI